jgi:peptidoglycan-N-acetylglucosamine deacetylase
MYLSKTPKFIQNLFPGFVWRVPTPDPVIYLTFDDGPIPQVTPWVLDLLSQYGAKGSFFCVGHNIDKHPQVFQRVVAEGHAVGNHTYNHVSGWASDNVPFFHNVRRCAKLVNSAFFRPPYGKLKPRQTQFIQRHYQIVMWDVLSGDFDESITKEQCYLNVIKNAGPGSIIVFHDSLKSEEKLRYALPKVLEFFSKKGYAFEALTMEAVKGESPVQRREPSVAVA